MRIHDMKTAGNKSVQVYASTEINVEEPTCLISVNGDANVLESVVLKKRQHYNKSKNGPQHRRRQCNDNNQSETNKPPNNQLNDEHLHEIVSVEPDVKHIVSKAFIDNFKMEIKEEVNSIEEIAVPFVNVSIKVEPGNQNYIEEENEESNDQIISSQPFDSDSDFDDEKPLIQRLENQVNKPINPMDKFKHIIESAFPIVLIKRLQYASIKSDEIGVKCETTSYTNTTMDKSEDKPTKDVLLDKHVTSTIKSENQSNLYKCSLCQKEVKTWPSLILHEQTHRKSFKCQICQYDCLSTPNLIKHIKTNPKCSRRNDTNLMCSLCDNGVRYKTQAAFNYHLTKHSGLRPFICDICKKSFRSKETLRQHMECHKLHKNYNCEVCGRGFPNKNHLKQHQLSHTDLKPFRCDVCNNFFKSQGRLYNHKKIHMKPQYSCCYCSKEFTIVGNLKIHEKRHMRSELIDKFECKICGKKFILKHDLQYHMRTHNVMLISFNYRINF